MRHCLDGRPRLLFVATTTKLATTTTAAATATASRLGIRLIMLLKLNISNLNLGGGEDLAPVLLHRGTGFGVCFLDPQLDAVVELGTQLEDRASNEVAVLERVANQREKRVEPCSIKLLAGRLGEQRLNAATVVVERVLPLGLDALTEKDDIRLGLNLIRGFDVVEQGPKVLCCAESVDVNVGVDLCLGGREPHGPAVF